MSNSEYISRDAVLCRLYNRMAIIEGTMMKMCYTDVIEEIKTFPAADVASVVHGRWILSTDMTYMPQCSNCGRHPFKGYIPSIEEVRRVYKFCPVCGAKMDESEDTDNA